MVLKKNTNKASHDDIETLEHLKNDKAALKKEEELLDQRANALQRRKIARKKQF